jgi:hypothetical protein
MDLIIFLPRLFNGIVTSPFDGCIASWIVPLFDYILKTLGFLLLGFFLNCSFFFFSPLAPLNLPSICADICPLPIAIILNP